MTDAQPNRPNVIFVFADQLRAHSVGYAGNNEVITPHIDRLAQEGLVLTNAISAQPVCTPCRAQYMTGRYGHSTGVIRNFMRLPDEETIISECFKEHGYSTGYIGKWHLDGGRANPIDAINRRGWDYWAVRNCSHDHFNPTYWLNDSSEPIQQTGWEPDVQTDLAIDFINNNTAKPFCLFLSFGPPHNPYMAPDSFLSMYPDAQALTSRPNAETDPEVLRHYYAMTTSLDNNLGRLTAAIDRAGLKDDTVIIFSSDHGDMLGSQGHANKQRPWEESINVPFVLRYPRRIQPQRCDYLFSSVDLMPTLLGLCDIPIPGNVQGVNYAPTFLGHTEQERDAVFLFNAHMNQQRGSKSDWRGIRTKRWTYAYHIGGDWVLYDLKQDPYQLNNLIAVPEYAKQKQELRQQLEAIRGELGEALPLEGTLPDPIRLPEAHPQLKTP